MAGDVDAEQLEADRKVVAALARHGDPLITPRPVDHWIYFATAADRAHFLDEVVVLGFSAYDADEQEQAPYCAQVTRVDPVDLESIHRVVMTLVAAGSRLSKRPPDA